MSQIDLTNLATLRQLCRRYGIRPDPGAGQHFLIDRGALDEIIAAASLTTGDTVLEVGPGFGTLTMELAKRARRVVAVELDPKLYAAAKEILSPYPNVELIRGNFLTLPPASYQLSAKSYKLVANLPYNISGRFFRVALTRQPKPDLIGVLVQAEVAQRLCAPPGALSVLGVMCQLYTEPRQLSRVPPEAFWPPPKVDSALVTMRVKSDKECSQLTGVDLPPETVLRIARVGFSARRKTLFNNLAAALPTVARSALEAAMSSGQVSKNVRAQELSVTQWISLAKRLKNHLS